MNIGIIGAGNIGATLARKLSAAGHVVKLANSKGPDSIRGLADGIGAIAAAKEDAVTGVEVIILSIPMAAYPEIANLMKLVSGEVTIIDTSNYYPFRDGAIAELDAGKPESVWVSEQVGRPVIKAWNAVLAATLIEKGGSQSSTRIAVPVAGDNAKPKATAMKLVEETGFFAVDAGTLAESWRQQPGTPAYCTELTAQELELALKTADRSRSADNREALIKEFIAAGGKLNHDQIVARNRAATA